MSANEFQFDPVSKTCICPANETMWLMTEGIDKNGNNKLHFEGRISKCRGCHLKQQCMRKPKSGTGWEGHGRQVSFIQEKRKTAKYIDWMKHRVDSKKGKHIYSHRMSVIEPFLLQVSQFNCEYRD